MLRRGGLVIVSGFTLIEAMIVIAIMAIVMALGMPSYKVWIQNTRIRNAAEAIQNGLKLARAEAVKRNSAVQFSLGTGSAWTVGCVTVTTSCPASIQSRSAGDGSSNTITVVAADATTIRFDQLGRMTAPTPVAGFTTIDIDSSTTALAAADSRELRIRVDVGGGIRMCDPNVSATDDPRKC